ncbi:MAG: hypothetical protein E7311_00695 [Clostridiales bacterium]|nr:hypothetical protein [Clostridiales bacterium]
MKEKGIKERLVNEIVEALINEKSLNDFYIKLLTSSGEINEYDITKVMQEKYEENPKVEEKFPTTRSIVTAIAKHVIATNNAKYIYHFATNADFVAIDELSDAIIHTKDYKYVCSFASSIMSGLKVNKFVDILVEYSEAEHIYNFIYNTFKEETNIFDAKDNRQEILNKLVDALLKTNNKYYIADLANSNINGVSLSKIEDAVIKANRALDIYHLADRVKESDKIKLCNAIAKLDDVDMCLHFATDIEGADINVLFDTVVEKGNDYWFDRFVKEVKGLSKDKIVEGIIKRNYFSIINESDLKLSKKHMNQIAEKVITLGVEDIIEFAQNIRNVPINKLITGIIQTGDAKAIYEFATTVKYVPLERLGNALIHIGNPTYIFLYAKAVMGINVEKYADAVIKAGEVYWMYKFANEIKNAPIDKIEKAILAKLIEAQ